MKLPTNLTIAIPRAQAALRKPQAHHELRIAAHTALTAKSTQLTKTNTVIIASLISSRFLRLQANLDVAEPAKAVSTTVRSLPRNSRLELLVATLTALPVSIDLFRPSMTMITFPEVPYLQYHSLPLFPRRENLPALFPPRQHSNCNFPGWRTQPPRLWSND